MTGVRSVVSLLVLFAIACAAPAPPSPAPLGPRGSPPSPIDDAPALRLPTDVHPRAERLSLDVDPARDSFHGVAEIDLHLDAPRSVLRLHGRDLRVTRTTVVRDGHALEARWTNGKDGLAEVRAATPFAAGDATLHVEYDAAFMPADVGLYRVSRGADRYAFTQFEEIEARRAFPCFDEPSFKSTFTTTLTVPAGAQAIANTNEAERTTLADGRVRIRFHETPPLPAYLAAFAVGPLEILRAADLPATANRPHALTIRGVAAKGRGGDLAYALARAGSIVTTLEDYFGVPFPFEKLDLVAVPNMGGAMENAGAITFGEADLLIDEKAASLNQKRNAMETIAHEIAHQWFGDLVTMAWWDDLWLNEGFATWMASKAMDRAEPSQRVSLLLLNRVDRAMSDDAREASRQIRQPIESNDDIENAFDTITYEKGGAVLGMFERWIGEEPFREGLRSHLEHHRFGSATSADLLLALSASAKRDVAAAFRTFLDQPGVPFVEVDVRCDGRPRAHLTQSRLVSIGSTLDANATWQIPLCARYGDGASSREACTLLDAHEGDLLLEACPTWLVPNANAAGYFRFAPSPHDLEKLRAHAGALSTRETMALMASLRASFTRGSTSAADLFATASALVNDPRPEIVAEAVAPFVNARPLLEGDPGLAAFETRTRALFRPAYDRIGWGKTGETESDDRRLVRAHVIAVLAKIARDPEVRAEAKRRALAFLGIGRDGGLGKDGRAAEAVHRDALDADLAEVVLPIAAEEADAPMFDAIVALLARTDDEPTRDLLVAAIASARDTTLAARARDLALTDALRGMEPFRVLDRQMGNATLTADVRAREAAWTWLVDHTDALLSRLHEPFVRARLIGLAGSLCDAAHAASVEAYFARFTSHVEGGPRTSKLARERTRLCAAQREALTPPLRAYFVEAAERTRAASAASSAQPRRPK